MFRLLPHDLTAKIVCVSQPRSIRLVGTLGGFRYIASLEQAMSWQVANQVLFKLKVNQDDDEAKAGEFELLEQIIIDLMSPIAERRYRNHDWFRIVLRAAADFVRGVRSCRLYYVSREILTRLLLGAAGEHVEPIAIGTVDDAIDDDASTVLPDDSWPRWLAALFDLVCLAERKWTYIRLYAPLDTRLGWKGRLAETIRIRRAGILDDLKDIAADLLRAWGAMGQPALDPDAILSFFVAIDQCWKAWINEPDDCATRAADVIRLVDILDTLSGLGKVPHSSTYPFLSDAIEKAIGRLCPVVPRGAVGNSAQALCEHTRQPVAVLPPGGPFGDLLTILDALPAVPKGAKKPMDILDSISRMPPPTPPAAPADAGPLLPNLVEQSWLDEAEPNRDSWPPIWSLQPRLPLWWLLSAQLERGSALWAAAYGVFLERHHYPKSRDLFPDARAAFRVFLLPPDQLSKDDLEAAKKVLKKWQLLLGRRKPPPKPSNDAPPWDIILIPPTVQENPDWVGAALATVDDWLDHPSQMPCDWQDVPEGIRETIVAALFKVYLDKLVQHMGLVYRVARKHARAGLTPALLFYLLGERFYSPRTWPKPGVVSKMKEDVVSKMKEELEDRKTPVPIYVPPPSPPKEE